MFVVGLATVTGFGFLFLHGIFLAACFLFFTFSVGVEPVIENRTEGTRAVFTLGASTDRAGYRRSPPVVMRDLVTGGGRLGEP